MEKVIEAIGEEDITIDKAVDKFDYNKGCSFFAHAKWYIRSAIWRGLLEHNLSLGEGQIHFLNAIKEAFCPFWY